MSDILEKVIKKGLDNFIKELNYDIETAVKFKLNRLRLNKRGAELLLIEMAKHELPPELQTIWEKHKSRLIDFVTEDQIGNVDLISAEAIEPKPIPNIIFAAGFFFPATIRDQAIGDMLERYEKDSKLVGMRRAKYWATMDLIRSQYPLFKQFLRSKWTRTLKKLGIEAIKRYFGGGN